MTPGSYMCTEGSNTSLYKIMYNHANHRMFNVHYWKKELWCLHQSWYLLFSCSGWTERLPFPPIPWHSLHKQALSGKTDSKPDDIINDFHLLLNTDLLCSVISVDKSCLLDYCILLIQYLYYELGKCDSVS